jgi:TRAP transporter TAXI family solute receptor
LAHPAAPILTLQTTKKLRFLQLNDEELTKIQKAYPMYRTKVMPQTMYSEFPQGGYKTIEIGTAVITYKDQPENLIYSIVKATFENVQMLKEAMASATYTVPERVKYLVLPIHPGALKYYQEKNVEVPANLIPAK